MGDQSGAYEHHVTGVIHEIALHTASVEALDAAFSHERDDCRAHSVILDLRHVGDSVDDDQIEVIVTHVDPDIRRWAVRVPEEGASRLVERLDAAGLGVVLIRGDGVEGPRRPGR